MKYLWYIIFAVFNFQIFVSGEEAGSLEDVVKNGVVDYNLEGALVGAVTLVARGDEVIDLQAHGVKNLESNEVVATDSIFKIHSFTKAITCAAALMLFEEGEFQFDDPISNWLPEYKSMKIESPDGDLVVARNPILVKHLFTHTSGISYKHSELFKGGGNLAEVVKNLAERPLQFEPGQSWEYGMSIDVLGRLVEIWSGLELAQYLDDKLLIPLEMKDTAFFVPAEKSQRRVLIYASGKPDTTDFKIDAENEEVPHALPEFCMPGGGLYSTAEDYFRFLRMIQNGGQWQGVRYLKQDSIDLMTTNQVPESVGWVQFGEQIRDGFGYGYGFNTVAAKSQWDPDARVGECGWGGKASCHYWFDPKEKITVITLEQIVPYRRSLEKALKGAIYQALQKAQ